MEVSVDGNATRGKEGWKEFLTQKDPERRFCYILKFRTRSLLLHTVTGHSRFSLKGHVFTLKYNAYLTEKTEKPMLIINSLVLVCKRYALLHRNLIYEGYFPDWFEYFCREIFSLSVSRIRKNMAIDSIIGTSCFGFLAISFFFSFLVHH